MLETIKTDRVDEIKQYIDEILAESEKKCMQDLDSYFEKNLEREIDSMSTLINALYQKAQQAQKDDKIGKITYIRVFPKRTAILEGKYQLQIRVYDEQDYKDLEEVSVDWNPEYITKYYEKHMELLMQKMPMKLFQMTTREKQLMKFMYADSFTQYILIVLAIFHDAFRYVENILELDTEEMMVLTFGNYMEEGSVVDIFTNPREEME